MLKYTDVIVYVTMVIVYIAIFGGYREFKKYRTYRFQIIRRLPKNRV